MSGFQRFVTYINLYEENSKIRNVGFARIERQGEQCTMEIHMRGTGYTGTSCPVYLFVRKDDKLAGIHIGKIQITGGIGDGRFLLDGSNISQSGYEFEQIGGFLILVTERVMFASQWDDKELRREQFAPLEKETEPKAQVPEKAQAQEKAEMTKEVQVTGTTVELQAAEAGAQPRPVEQKEEPWAIKWQFLLENYPVLTPFESETEILCIRMELKDIRLLPKRYWYLGNNSFLLHGFFNYRYLILGAMEVDGEKRWFLGIPGVFQSQEKVMAAIFGFPEYRSEKRAEQKTGQFGYWYRLLE